MAAESAEPIATTVKLLEDTRVRARAAAAEAGMTTHAWLVDVVEKAVERSEKWKSFLAEADEAEDELVQTGEGYDANELFTYLEEKTAGKATPHPKPVKWRE